MALDVAIPTEASAVPTTVQQRLVRGREAMKRDAPKRRLCQRFERGDTYFYVNSKNQLSAQNTVTNPDGSGKPAHRIRNSYNVIRPIIQGKVSTATQRTPSYQVLPSTTDQQRVSAAELAEKAALYGYGQWDIGEARRTACRYAIGGGGEGFCLPYFDANVGPYVEVPDPLDPAAPPQVVGQGEIKILSLHGNQVYWEPGCKFRESRWWAIERAVPKETIEEMPGYLPGDLKADASTSDIPTDDKPSDQMVLLTSYYERPCPKYPDGRLLTIANRRQVIPEEDYPLKAADGSTLDEPCIHRLAWDDDEGLERDFGLTWQLVDCERTIQDCINKILEWKNRCLNPRMLARLNALITRPNDEPGGIDLYQGPDAPEWEQTPVIPDSLFKVLAMIQQIMRTIASDDQTEANADLSNVAARTLQQTIEQSLNRWQAFMARMADWDSRLMRHCLLLAARHYSEPRLLKIKGRDGWERIPDFQGADLMGEVDVRVFPDSLVPLTRQGVQDMITWLNQNFPGWLSPQDALAALQEGSLDRLTESYWLDKARANEIIQRIRDGSVVNMPARGQTDPVTGQPSTDPQTGAPLDIPGYMPDQQNNLQIWERVFSDWLKTDDYARQEPWKQAIARQIWDGIKQLKMAKAVEDAQLQTAMAEQAGMANAAKPQGPKSMPSLPGGRTPGVQQ